MPQPDKPRIETAQGVLEGRVLVGGAGPAPSTGAQAGSRTHVGCWLGIPYAQAPVGALRWRPPQAALAWSGVRDAGAFSPDTVQAGNGHLRGGSQSEDALTINVWAPLEPPSLGLPVMVWFHGGGFTGGSGSDQRSDGAVLAQGGVVVVSFNYRSGVFGFLAHPELRQESPHGAAGNYGLLDQLLALRWVRDHIRCFGGDPERVTVFGVSAGSASISLLLTAPQARGLFQQAILHSPGAGRPLAHLDEAADAGARLGLTLAQLRALPAKEVLALTARLNPAVRGLTSPRVLRPIEDGWLIPEQERAALLAGRHAVMPLIVGSNLDEGSLLTRNWPIDDLPGYRELMRANFGESSEQAQVHYRAAHDSQARAAVAAAFADTQFNLGVRLLARAMVAQTPAVWRYLFTRRRPGQSDGPHHADEVPYVFGTLQQTWGDAVDTDDVELSARMRAAWIAFARWGRPDHPGPSATPWPAYERPTDPHLIWDAAPQPGRQWRQAALDFLDAYLGAGTKG